MVIAALIVAGALGLGLARHEDALQEANLLYQRELRRVKQDARARAEESEKLEVMYQQMTANFQSLEQTSTATIATLNRHLDGIRRQHGRLNRLVAQHQGQRERLEREWTLAQAELGRAGTMVHTLQEHLNRWQAEAQRAHEAQQASELRLALTSQRLQRAQAQIERQQKEIAGLKKRQAAQAKTKPAPQRRSIRRRDGRREGDESIPARRLTKPDIQSLLPPGDLGQGFRNRPRR